MGTVIYLSFLAVVLLCLTILLAILKAGSDADDHAEANPRADDFNQSWDM